MRFSVAAVCMMMVLTACVGTPAPDATGAEIFDQVCSRCHGANLGGGVGPALGPDSEAAVQPDEFLIQTITAGRGRMPSFAKTLTEDQVLRVVEYLRRAQAGT